MTPTPPNTPTDLPDLPVLGAAPAVNGWSFDPVTYLRAVNALVGHPVDRCVTALLTCAGEPSLSAGAAELALVARVVFVPRDRERPLPPPSLGRPDVALPPGDIAWPFLPVVLSGGLPFLCVGGYRVGGLFDFEGWLRRSAAEADVRSQPLVPTTTPVDSADALTGDRAWLSLFGEADRARITNMVRGQALRAARAGSGADPALASAPPPESDRLWAEHARAVRALGLRWAAGGERFEPADGGRAGPVA